MRVLNHFLLATTNRIVFSLQLFLYKDVVTFLKNHPNIELSGFFFFLGTEFVELDPHRSFGTCVSFTNFHYRTFDGTHYNFEGNCAYVLVEDRIYSHFKISVDNSYACEQDPAMTCNSRVRVLTPFQNYRFMNSSSRISP